jgi:hypothetical protein
MEVLHLTADEKEKFGQLDVTYTQRKYLKILAWMLGIDADVIRAYSDQRLSEL